MSEFWEGFFKEKQTLWGFTPSKSTLIVKDFFIEKRIKNVLFPGIGYGRNAKVLIDNNINVTGIEISQTAINLATKSGINVPIYHGSVSNMPFDDTLYEGIYSYALLHLLNENDRKKFIHDCYKQLKPNGYMIFVTVSKKSAYFKSGQKLGEDYYEVTPGINMFFYDKSSIHEDFAEYGLMETLEVDESNNVNPAMQFTLIKCKKQ